MSDKNRPSKYKTQTQAVTARFINSTFVRKVETEYTPREVCTCGSARLEPFLQNRRTKKTKRYYRKKMVRCLDCKRELTAMVRPRVMEAEAEGTAFIRKKLREESFARDIILPIMLSDDEIDRE